MDRANEIDCPSHSADKPSHVSAASVLDVGDWARWFRITWWGHRVLLVLGVAFLYFAANLPNTTRDMFTAVDPRLVYTVLGTFMLACVVSGLIAYFDMRRINFGTWPLFLSFWSAILIVAIIGLFRFALLPDLLGGNAGAVTADPILSQNNAWRLAAVVFSLILIVHLLRIRGASIPADSEGRTARLSQLPGRSITRPLALRRASVVCLHLMNLVAVFALLHPVLWMMNYLDSFILPEVLYGATADPYVLRYDQKMDWMPNLLWLHHGREAPAHVALVWIVQPILMIIVAVLAFRTGLKIIRKIEGGIWRESGIPPILLLRSFNDDYAVIRPTSWFRRLTGRNVRLEETVARELAVDGPLVAIGKPGEMLPELGAYRMYFTDDQWQSAVIVQLRNCQCVVVVGGTTHWVLWELQQVIENGCAAKLLLVLPPCNPQEKSERIAPLIKVLDLSPSQVEFVHDQIDKLLVVSVLADSSLDLYCSDNSTQSDYQVACRVAIMRKGLAKPYSTSANVIASPPRHHETQAAPGNNAGTANENPPIAVGKRPYGRRILAGGTAALLGLSGIAVGDVLLGNFSFGRHLTFVDSLGCDTYVRQSQSPYGTAFIEPDRALAACQDALSGDEGNPAHLHAVGVAELAKKDYGAAIKHLRAAAEQGYAPAMLSLAMGLLFQELPDQFENVDEQRAEGVKWVLRASDGGEEDAYFNLALAMSVGNQDPQNRDLVSAAYCLIALQKGSSQAFFTLADMTMHQLSLGTWQLTLDMGPMFKSAFQSTQHGVEVILADLGFFHEVPDSTWTYATMDALYRFLQADVKIDPLNLCFARDSKQHCYREPYARRMRNLDDVIAHYLELEDITILDALSSKRPAHAATHSGRVQGPDLAKRRLSLIPLGDAIGSLYAKLLSRRDASAANPTQCDRLTAHPFDPNRAAKGVPFERLQPDAAIAACNDAVRQAPDVARLHYQRGRSYLKAAERTPSADTRAETYAKAQADFRDAAARGYPMAHYALAVMVTHGEGVPKDLAAGAARHVEAFNRIVRCCGAAVAEHLLEVEERYDPASVTRGARTLLEWGASLGDPKSHAALARHFGAEAANATPERRAHIDFSSDPPWINR